MADCLIIGGGIAGCALAREMARRGASVTLLEAADHLAAGASGAAIGTLSYSPGARMPQAWHNLASRALEAHRAMEIELRNEIAGSPEWHWPGRLSVATTNAAEKHARAIMQADRQGGEAGEWFDKRAIHEMEPLLGPKVQGGSFKPGQGWVHAAALTLALAEAATAYGARCLTGAPVERLLWQGARVVGAVASGVEHRAAQVVIAAGAWAGGIDGRLTMPIEPVRGQALHLDLRGSTVPFPPLTHLVSGHGIYMIPEGDGITIGSTHERSGFELGVTAGGLADLLGGATILIPALREANWSRARVWSGLRPATPDHLPVLGSDPRFPGLWWSSGYFRSGILLAPVASAILAKAMLSGAELDSRLSPSRFTA